MALPIARSVYIPQIAIVHKTHGVSMDAVMTGRSMVIISGKPHRNEFHWNHFGQCNRCERIGGKRKGKWERESRGGHKCNLVIKIQTASVCVCVCSIKWCDSKIQKWNGMKHVSIECQIRQIAFLLFNFQFRHLFRYFTAYDFFTSSNSLHFPFFFFFMIAAAGCYRNATVRSRHRYAVVPFHSFIASE